MPVPSPISSVTVTKTIQLAYLGSVTHATSFQSPEGLILVLVQILAPKPISTLQSTRYIPILRDLLDSDGESPGSKKKEAQNQGIEGAFGGTIT